MILKQLDEGRLARFTIKEDYQLLFSHYVEGGWIGIVWQQDDEHVYIKKVNADINSRMYFGAIERMPRDMMEDVIYLV